MNDDTTPPADHAAPEPAPRSLWLTNQRAGFVALGVSVLALGLTAAPYLTGGDFGGRVRTYLLANPQVLQEVSTALQAQGEAARVEAINTAIAANASLLAPDPRDPAFGPVDAKVTVIEFFDFRCPGCKATAPDYLKIVRSNPDVRFVFKDWPILDRGDDVTSQYAARAALAAHQQGKYLPVFEALMAQPSLTETSIDSILAANGVSLPAAKAAIASPGMTRHVADIHTTAAAIGLQGTPTFIINGVASASIEPAAVARQIEAARRV